MASSTTATLSAGVTFTLDNTTVSGQNIYKITATTASETVTFSSTSDGTGRPSTAVDGEFRYNTTTKKVEYYDGADWFALTSTTAVPQTGTTGACNYPTTATALYQFSSDATDTCGNYNGTNDSGIAYTTPGKFGNGAQFGGGSDRIDIDQALLGSGTTKIWSTSFWFNTSSATEQYMNNTAAYSSGKGYSVYIRSNGYLLTEKVFINFLILTLNMK